MTFRRCISSGLGIVAFLVPLTTAEAQSARAGRAPAVSRDSAATLRRARRAQSAFEVTRRNNLPRTDGAPSSRCDMQVGRFCYWDDDGQPKPRPEAKQIGRARARLLAALDSAALDSPGDEWIAGQRVRYLLEARDHERALEAARECRAAAWWCAALAGLVLHQDSMPLAADSAFRVALAVMPDDERCRWNDVSYFLSGATERAWKRARCSDPSGLAVRDSIAARLWWLARPFLSRPTNDRRTEHFARRTMSRIESMAAAGYDSRWGDDTDELMIRFGWPVAWARHLPAFGSMATPSIVGWEATPSFHFIPDARAMDREVHALRDELWAPALREAPERYAPSYAEHVRPLRAQIAVFRRGDEALIVAAAQLPDDTLFSGDDSLLVHLAATHTPGLPPRVASRAGGDTALTLRAPWRDALVGIELFAPARRATARHRTGVKMPPRTGRLSVSDLLLFDAERAPSPSSLDAVLGAMLGEARTGIDRRVGVLWETYGLADGGETIDVSLEVERVRASWTTRAAERLRLSSAASPIRVRWAETPDRGSGAAVRALTLDLTHLGAGLYEVRLRVTTADGATATAVRELAVER